MPEDDRLSESVQDYLKTIYELSPGGEPTSTNQIAEHLKVEPPSVTGMLKRLAVMNPPLVDYHKHHGVRLTDEGLRISLQLIRKHRLLELFMVEILGYTWDEVHEEAERLEHAISFRFGDRLARLLGEPDFDPHGDPIPGRDLRLPSVKSVSLSETQAGQNVIVRRVPTSNPALLRYLGEMGVLPGARLVVLEQVPFDRTARIRVEADGAERVLGFDISLLLQVEVL
jgi:DtxR family transcriptional regulator, Mn-dependent transcriptional regulator